MPELQFLKTLIFSRALLKLQNWVNFSNLFIVNGSTMKRWKDENAELELERSIITIIKQM